jgi:uncharacterized protein (TIGR03435 family)
MPRIGYKLKFATPVAVLLALGNARPSYAQSSPKFEVASIKPTDPAFTGRSLQMPLADSMVRIRGMSLKDLIRYAWGESGPGLHPSLVSGGPNWYDRSLYDIVAKSEGSRIPSQDDRKQMLRALLSERFQLKFHREPKEIAVYALIVGKNGPKMKERAADDGGAPFSMLLNGLHIPGRNASMAELANVLESLIPLTDPERDDRPVLDKTGLAGRFDFELTWAPDPTRSGGRGGPPGDSANAPDLFIAVQEQLGLKLESARARVEALVIDHVEKPSEN